MNQNFNVDVIKNYLRILYQNSNQKEEAEQFFKNLIASESQCSALFELLIDIIIKDEDINLKHISIIIIRQMSFNFIFNSIFLLNQKMNPNFYQIIEILTDYLASKKSVEIIPLINNFLTTTQDLAIQKSIVQLLSSIYYLVDHQKIEIDDSKEHWSNYYKYFIQTANFIISKEINDQNEIIFLYYFVKSFKDLIIQSRNIDFFHKFTCFCLHQKNVSDIFKKLIENSLPIYGKLIRSLICETQLPIIEFFTYFNNFCQATHYIPISSLYVWREFFVYINKFESLPGNLNELIINYVFPFFKFQPQLINDDPEQFLDEIAPESEDLPLNDFFSGISSIPRFPSLSNFIFQFATTYFSQYINSNIFEICRLLIFVSRFLSKECEENRNYIVNIYQNIIFPLINSIGSMASPNLYLSIAICEFIRVVSSLNDSPIFENKESLFIIVSFLKWCVLNQSGPENVSKFLFYFSFNAISAKFKQNVNAYFNFTNNEISGIFMRLYQLNTEFQTYSMNDLLVFLIKNLMPENVNIQQFVRTIWDFCISLKDELNRPFLLNKYLGLFEMIFNNCKSAEGQQVIFQDMFVLLSNEMERSKDWLIMNCYDSILSLMVSFTFLLDSNEKVPFFMDTIGRFIYNMLFSFNPQSYSSEFDIYDLISPYQTFFFLVFQKVTDPTICLETIIKPFLLPIVVKFDELIQYINYEFDFMCLNAPLIKFKGNDAIFQCMWNFYPILQGLKTFITSSKIDFVRSLVISKPSILFEYFNQQQFLDIVNDISLTITFIHIYAIKEILVYLSKTNPDIEIIKVIAASFFQRMKSEDILDERGEVSFGYEDAILIEHEVFNEDMNIVIQQINQMLHNWGIS